MVNIRTLMSDCDSRNPVLLDLFLSFDADICYLFRSFPSIGKFLFNRDLNRSCLVYMFSLSFSGSKFLINLRQQFRVRKIFS